MSRHLNRSPWSFTLSLAAWCLGALPAFAQDTTATNPRSTWPTVHKDYQRSGYTPEVITGPHQRKWFRDFHDELIATRVEAIVAEGRAFVGTLAGNVYALDVIGGKTSWTFHATGPIGASACYDAGRVYIGADDGFLYCLQATDGKEIWRYAAGAGIWAAPACDGQRIFFGDRAGIFHALDAKTGKSLWTLTTDGMILTPASLSQDGQRIVFGSEDMHIYCADPAGKLLWKSTKLGGLSLRDHAPTIWQGLAIVRTNPAASYHRAAGETPAVLTAAQKALPMLPEDKLLFDKWGTYALKLTPRRLEAERQAILKFIQATPAEKTFYAFQLEDGREPWTAPVLYTCGMDNTPTPPTFNPNTGELFLWLPTSLTNYAAGVPGGAVAVGKLDRKTGFVDLLLHANSEAFNSHAGFCPPADETFALSLMGNTLLNTHQGIVGQMDLQTRKCGILCGQRDSYGGIFGPTYVPDTWNGGQEKAHLAGQLVFLPNEWHGPDRSIVSIADNRIFWVVGSQVVCIAGPNVPKSDTGGDKYPGPIRRRTPLATPGGNLACTSFGSLDTSIPKPQITPAQLKKYLDPPPSPARINSPLQLRLDTAVAELVNGAPWAPLIVELGPSGEERHFWRTAETMQILANALPYLSPQTQALAKRYLTQLFAAGSPLNLPVHPGTQAQRREFYDVGPQMLDYATTPIRYQSNVEDLYALWAYAHYAGSWPAVLEQKPAIQSLFAEFLKQPVNFNHADKENDAAEHLNAQIAGTLAYARIMTKAGEAAEVDQAMARLAELVIERVYHEQADTDFVRPSQRARYKLHQAQIPRYTALTPEVSAMLHDLAGEKLASNVRMLTKVLPVWHHAFCERMIGGESYTSTPSLARGLFAALADGIQATPAELAAKLDQPWCKGDLYHIEKLTAVLRASARP